MWYADVLFTRYRTRPACTPSVSPMEWSPRGRRRYLPVALLRRRTAPALTMPLAYLTIRRGFQTCRWNFPGPEIGASKGTDRGNLRMTDDQPFIDYYNILQVNPDCDARALETAYRHLAKMHHPDHSVTADVTKLNDVIEAYRKLKSPDLRAEYDLQYAAETGFEFASSNEAGGDERVAISDADAHAKILMYLYKRRREHAQDAGVGRYFVQEILNCSDENFDFHLWYLKAKGFIEATEQGTLAITIEGVDHVISKSRTTMKEKLRISQSSDPPEQAQ